jgi:DNA invertase Pin-like site-specific DNA recombinase
LKVGIYCRLSEEDRNKQNEADDSNSIQNQKTMLLQYAIEQGWDVYDIYADDDYTGSDRRRPQFNKLLRDAESRKFDIVLCKTQSRFTRELELVEKYIHSLFPIWGIRFVSILDHADTANAGNKKSRQINGLVNEWYLEDLSNNIRGVLTSRRQNGNHIGSFALYGYQKDPNVKGHLIIDEEAAAVVREVFTLFSKGYGKTPIARILNERGIPNPTEYKRRKGLRYKHPKTENSTLWKYSTISHMLTNEIYIGNMVQGKYESVSYKTKVCRPRSKDQWYIVTGTHEPIIPRELWDQVQALIVQKAKPFNTGKIGLFARKVHCAYCDFCLRSAKNHGKYYLQCQTRHVSKDTCVGTFMPVAELEQMVIDELNRLSAKYLNKDELERKIAFATNIHKHRDDVRRNIAAYEKRTQECSKGIRDLYMDKVKGLIDDNDFIKLSEAFRTDRANLENMITTAQTELHTLDHRLREGDDRRKLIEQYTNVEHLTREMVELLIDHIVIHRRNPDTKRIPIQIYWKF